MSSADRPLRIALVGTRGVPARYGGFETCVEEVGSRLVDRGHGWSSTAGDPQDVDRADRPDAYRGMELVHLPALRRALAGDAEPHRAVGARTWSRHRTDAAIVFNAANAPFLPVLRAARIPVATHVDGLEWKRGKWGDRRASATTWPRSRWRCAGPTR